MFCPKCGTEIPDGSKFCGACGERLTEPAEQITPPETPAEPETVAEAASESGNTPPETVNTAASVPQGDQTAKADTAALNIDELKKKFSKKRIITIAVAVVAVIAVIFGVKALFSLFGGDEAYVYVSDGSYGLLTDLSGENAIEIASTRSDYAYASFVEFSPDGKYVYYITRYDSSLNTGSLNRAEIGRLGENASRNERYIETIATNVRPGIYFLDDGSFCYLNGDSAMYYYTDGEEPIRLARDVSYVSVLEDGRFVYIVQDGESGEYSLYGADVSDPSNAIRLGANIATASDIVDNENVFYTRLEDDGTYSLYIAGFEREAEKLGNNASVVAFDEDTVYYTIASGTTVSLYDFVDDAHAEADEGITEPDVDDFSVPRYYYEMVYGEDLVEEDFDELYTSCTHDLYWYGQSTWGSYSMEEAVDMDWGDNTEAIQTATQAFIDRFGDTADEDGYILVTDEVKAALQEIQKYAEVPENEWQWMWLCYNKYESGTTTDYDAYNAAYEEWAGARNRIELREELLDSANDFEVLTLYRYENGKTTVVSENVLDVLICSSGVLFNTTELVTDTVSIDSIYSVSDVEELFEVRRDAENYVLFASNGEVRRMSMTAAETYADEYDENYAQLYMGDDRIFLSSGNELYVAEADGDTIGGFTLLSEDASPLDADGNTMYYAEAMYDNNGFTYGDLYSYSGGESERIAVDIMINGINRYEDGVLLAFTGYRDGYGYELTMIDADGETALVSEDVTQYVRVDGSTVLYLSDGDLYCYDDGDKTMLHADVDLFWCLNAMEAENTFGYGY